MGETILQDDEYSINEVKDLDYEIADLVRLLNKVEGIRTRNSCFGHNKAPITIFCEADSIKALNKLRYNYLYCNDMWQIELILSDTAIANNDWNIIEFVLKTSDLYYSYPVTQLLADNLTMRMRDILNGNVD